ncbi:hypothetical protein HBNXNv_0079 [Candidatus Nanohalovita haloferacivicina]|nr:hypothetical protein HBNXNv_0079 [Candidatus Nanohalobia archaeon BNXNv]
MDVFISGSLKQSKLATSFSNPEAVAASDAIKPSINSSLSVLSKIFHR